MVWGTRRAALPLLQRAPPRPPGAPRAAHGTRRPGRRAHKALSAGNTPIPSLLWGARACRPPVRLTQPWSETCSLQGGQERRRVAAAAGQLSPFRGAGHSAVRVESGDGRRAFAGTAEGPEHIVVIGGGSLGSLFAGRLGTLKTLRGRVWMLTSWEEQVAAVQSNQGIVVQEQGPVGSGCLIGQVRAMRSLAEVREIQNDTVNSVVRGRVNVVIIAVKQPGIRKAAEQAAQILADVHGGLCITVLNGLGHIEVVKNALRNHDVRATLAHGEGRQAALARPVRMQALDEHCRPSCPAGVFTGGARMEDPGLVVHAGQGDLSLAGTPQPPPSALSPAGSPLLPFCRLAAVAALPLRLAAPPCRSALPLRLATPPCRSTRAPVPAAAPSSASLLGPVGFF